MNDLSNIQLIVSRMYEVKQDIENLRDEYKSLEDSKRQLQLEHNEQLFKKQLDKLKKNY